MKRLRSLIAIAVLGTGLSMGTIAFAQATSVINGTFETGDLTGWTASSVNNGLVFTVQEGTCWSFFDTTGIILNGNFAANIRSSGPAPVTSVGILTSAPFIAASGVSFIALSENADAPLNFPNPVNFEVRILAPGPMVVSQVVTTNIVTLGGGPCSVAVPVPRNSTFSPHFIDTSAFIGQSIQIEFRQHTNIGGLGWFTLVDDVMTVPVAVPIDIKPGSFPNSINLGSGGNVPVAILSTLTFDATTVDPTSVTLAGGAVRLRRNGTPMASFQDVNGDGLQDLVVHVSTQALQLSQTDTQAGLNGITFGGVLITGTDTIMVVP